MAARTFFKVERLLRYAGMVAGTLSKQLVNKPMKFSLGIETTVVGPFQVYGQMWN